MLASAAKACLTSLHLCAHTLHEVADLCMTTLVLMCRQAMVDVCA